MSAWVVGMGRWYWGINVRPSRKQHQSKVLTSTAPYHIVLQWYRMEKPHIIMLLLVKCSGWNMLHQCSLLLLLMGKKILTKKGLNEILSAVLVWLTSGNLIIWEEVHLANHYKGVWKIAKESPPPPPIYPTLRKRWQVKVHLTFTVFYTTKWNQNKIW